MRETSETYLQKASEYLMSEKWEEAIAAYQRALELNPNLPGIHQKAERAGEGNGLDVPVSDVGGVGVRVSGRSRGEARHCVRLLLCEADEGGAARAGER